MISNRATDVKRESTSSAFWSGKRVLVTGGLGFIGRHLTAKLLDMGARVTILDNASNPSQRYRIYQRRMQRPCCSRASV
ncbi:NAD(P)-dependent oxidoreductase [Candidatus Gottesmanbacteria bacterium]|nr:NAD(P)-dependent oxidoreductase [Candidatus Gottesmanbacteria bacterium]